MMICQYFKRNFSSWREWKEWTAKILAGILISISGILLIIFISICFIYFPPRGLNSGLQSMGLYGDFIGGIMGAIIAIASLGVTVYVAVVLQRIERENVKQTIETQKAIAVVQIKFEEFVLFRSIFDRELAIISDGKTRLLSNIDYVDLIEYPIQKMYEATQRLLIAFPDIREQLDPFNFGVTIDGDVLRIQNDIITLALSISNADNQQTQENYRRAIEAGIRTLQGDYPFMLGHLISLILGNSNQG